MRAGYVLFSCFLLSCGADQPFAPQANLHEVQRSATVGGKEVSYFAERSGDIQIKSMRSSWQDGQKSDVVVDREKAKHFFVDVRLRVRDGQPLFGFLPIKVGEKFATLTLAVPNKVNHINAIEDFMSDHEPKLNLTRLTLDRQKVLEIPEEQGGGMIPMLEAIGYRNSGAPKSDKDKVYQFR